jgi:hypothetical protein
VQAVFAAKQAEAAKAAEVGRRGPQAAEAAGGTAGQPGDSPLEYCSGVVHLLGPMCQGCGLSVSRAGDRVCCAVVRWCMGVSWALVVRLVSSSGKLSPAKLTLAFVIAAAGLYWWMHTMPAVEP